MLSTLQKWQSLLFLVFSPHNRWKIRMKNKTITEKAWEMILNWTTTEKYQQINRNLSWADNNHLRNRKKECKLPYEI